VESGFSRITISRISKHDSPAAAILVKCSTTVQPARARLAGRESGGGDTLGGAVDTVVM
jgi:hypothetical protein